MNLLGVEYNGEGRRTFDYKLKITYFLFAACFLLFFIITQSAYAQTISVAPTSRAFGNVLVGNNSAPQIFTISHSGAAGEPALAVSNIALGNTTNYSLDLNAGGATACGSTTPSIAVGASCTVGVTFGPAAAGASNTNLTITSNATNSPTLNVPLTGTGFLTIAVAPSNVNFGSVLVDDSSTAQIITISHAGAAPLVVSNIALTNSTNYSLNLNAGGGSACGSTAPTIAVGGSCTVGVTFSPASAGTLNATLNVSSNFANNSPFGVSLTGRGVAPEIAVTPTSAVFGDVLVGDSSASQNFVIRNTGTAILSVFGIALTDTFNYSLNLNAGGANACGSTNRTIAANGGSCTVAVTFNPNEIGVLDGILRITSDDADESRFDIDLTGRGITATDNDGDGMADGWEQQIIDADPNDAIEVIGDVNPNDDFDGDGVTNFQEFKTGTSPINARPNAPALLLPANGSTQVSLTPQLETEAFSDPEGDAHILTRWQVSTDQNFVDEEQLVLDLVSDTDLISFVVPDLALDLDTQYYWRAAFVDGTGQESAWPDAPFSLTTDSVDENDQDLNGIPDNQEINCAELFGEGGVPANTVCVSSAAGGGLLGLEGSTNVASIEAYRSVDPANIPDALSGIELGLGLISFKAVCNSPGNTIEVIYHLSEPIPSGSKIYKWHPIDGWREHTDVEFLPDGKSVLIRVTDGGEGDMDNATNGIVIDPSGVGTSAAAGSASSASRGGDGNYDFTCFIETARFVSLMTIEWSALILLVGYGILMLHRIRKKH